MNIALVTYHDEGKYSGEGSTEDSLLQKYLAQKGLQVSYQIWTDLQVNWPQYDAVILKSPWDYFDKIKEFESWLDLLETGKVRVLNPVNIIRWNSNKSYLLDIEKAGLAIVPTQIVPQHTHFKAAPFFTAWQTNNIIVKPVVSGGAKNTFSITSANASEFENRVNELLEQEAFLVQPFMPEVQSQGEWSLIFLNGNFSHCVLKVPKSGDFRVQHYFGGIIIPTSPPAHVLTYAQKLVQQFAAGCLYARVDGLESNGEFRLMELELIEPFLFLSTNQNAFENYYLSLKALLKL